MHASNRTVIEDEEEDDVFSRRPFILWFIYCSFKVMYLLYYYSVLTVVYTDQGKWPVLLNGFPVAQMIEHGASNAKMMGSIPRESKSWSNVT